MPAYPDIRPDWLRPENKSVLDPWYKKAVRGLVTAAGGNEPDVSIADPMTVVTGPVKGLVGALRGLGPALEKGKQFGEEFTQLAKTQGSLSAPAVPFVKQLEEFAAQPIRVPEGPPVPYGFGVPTRPRVLLPEGFTMEPQYAHQVNPTLPHGGKKTLGLTRTSPTVEAERLARGRFEYLQREVDRNIPKADIPSVRGLEDLGSIASKGPQLERRSPMTTYERRALERGNKPGSLRGGPQGAQRPTVISDDQVKQIRQLARDGKGPGEIAAALGLNRATVGDIITGRTRAGVK